MSIQSELKKEGIEVIEHIDKLLATSIAQNVARRIVESFPDLELDEGILFDKFSCLKMFKAELPEGMAEASYFYKEHAIYFNNHIDNEDLEEFAIHECIHHLQERINEKGELYRMGLCSYDNTNPIGLALNEAAVQYSASHIIGIEPDFEKYYNITLYTPSPSYYPLECALLNEILYFTGTDLLYRSTIFSTYDFKNRIIELTSKDTFDVLQDNFDKLLDLEEDVIKISHQIALLEDGSKKFKKLDNKLNIARQKITDMFFAIQKVIIEDFFEGEFNRISSLEQLDDLKQRLYKFSDIMGTTDNYTFFDSFYAELMNKIEHKSSVLKNGGIETALTIVNKQNTFLSWMHKLLKFVFKGNETIDN